MYNSFMSTSRQRILEFIDRNNTVTTAEISRAMGLTQANIRHHLSILQDHGLVKIRGERPLQGRGRPAHLFSLSSKFKGNNLEILLSSVLTELEQDNTIQLKNILARVAWRVSQHTSSTTKKDLESDSSKQLTMRLMSTVESLSGLNYRAHWEAHIEGPQIFLGNCPYLSILNKHPQLCFFDKLLIQELISNSVEQKVKLNKDERNIPYCMFQVTQN